MHTYAKTMCIPISAPDPGPGVQSVCQWFVLSFQVAVTSGEIRGVQAVHQGKKLLPQVVSTSCGVT